MPASLRQSPAEPDPDLVDLTVVVRAHQAMYGALLGLVQCPFDDAALGRVLQVRQTLAGEVLRAELRIGGRQ